MQLRPRQREFVSRVDAALTKHGNTLAVAPTGFGKSCSMSAVGLALGGRGLVLQHRDELVDQNRKTYRRVAPSAETDVFNADRKRWSPGVTFGMVQTLAGEDNLESMPALDWVIVDECHHVAAETYRRIINKARERNPKAKVFGVTATPQRGDKKALIEIFNNVADVVQLSEVIAAGDLVRPRVFVIDCGLRSELSGIKRVSDFDQLEVEAIMDKEAVTGRVIEEWKKLAGDRQTVVFASTVKHAEHVCEAFEKEGIKAGVITGEMSKGDRARVLGDFEKGRLQVLLNVAVLTEGWDCQTVSCVILLRKCSYKGTMTQMIGRGLRKVDPERHPGVYKSDCIVMDFGYSILNNGDLNTDVVLEPHKGKPMTKDCPECGMKVPAGVANCPVCDHVFDGVARRQQEAEEKGILENFTLTEVEILELSPYRWQDMFDGAVMMANAMSAWAMLVMYRDRWHAVGKADKGSAHLLAVGSDKVAAMASADDFLREHGDKDASRKTKRWLTEPATEKQLSLLGVAGQTFMPITKYLASCQLTWRFNEKDIQRLVMRA